MRTDTTEPVTPSIDAPTPSQTTLFELLADEQRRYVLHYLSRTVGAVALDDVAEQVALREGNLASDQGDLANDPGDQAHSQCDPGHGQSGPSRDQCDKVLTGLYHRHLPKLTDAGVVGYDPERETVYLRDAADRLAPYLRLAATEDLGA